MKAFFNPTPCCPGRFRQQVSDIWLKGQSAHTPGTTQTIRLAKETTAEVCREVQGWWVWTLLQTCMEGSHCFSYWWPLATTAGNSLPSANAQSAQSECAATSKCGHIASDLAADSGRAALRLRMTNVASCSASRTPGLQQDVTLIHSTSDVVPRASWLNRN